LKDNKVKRKSQAMGGERLKKRVYPDSSDCLKRDSISKDLSAKKAGAEKILKVNDISDSFETLTN
jgi:hypothetical protein